MKYQVEYAKFVKVEIEAASLEEAKESSLERGKTNIIRIHLI